MIAKKLWLIPTIYWSPFNWTTDRATSCLRYFFDNINRGGLSRPSDHCYSATLNCWRVYEDMRSSSALNDKLLGAENQRSLCVKVVERAVENDQLVVADNYCTKGHNLKEQRNIYCGDSSIVWLKILLKN